MKQILLLTPFIGALIGWFTNYLAVKMIFRPQKPINIPLLGLTIHGLIPKRKGEIAKNLGEIIERELISWDGLAEEIINAGAGEHLMVILATRAKETIINSLPGITPGGLKEKIGDLAEGIINKQGPPLLEEIAVQSVEQLKEHFVLSQFVEDKVNQMDWDEMEALVLEIASKELKHIEVLGGIIGFIIGSFQLLISYLFS